MNFTACLAAFLMSGLCPSTVLQRPSEAMPMFIEAVMGAELARAHHGFIPPVRMQAGMQDEMTLVLFLDYDEAAWITHHQEESQSGLQRLSQ